MGDASVGTGATVAVLGSTTVGGEDLTGRQRALVAALAFHRTRGATAEVLIDAVWPRGIPRSARASLQNQVARLRRRFGPDLVLTDGSGYRLGRPCDVDRFEALVAPWLERSPSELAVPPLESGLALWRGQPYADLAEHAEVEPERTRLVELHAQAAESLAAGRIAAGDARAAAVELGALVEADPFRERRWHLLMTALRLDGRRAEALAAYDRLAVHLGRELGARPSSALQALRASIEQEDDGRRDREADGRWPAGRSDGAHGADARHRDRRRARCPSSPRLH